MGRLIDADHVKDFFFSETSGTEDVIRDLMDTHGLDYVNDINEEVIMAFAKDLLKAVQNVIDTEPTAYDPDKVVEQLDKASDYYEFDEQGMEHVRYAQAISFMSVKHGINTQSVSEKEKTATWQSFMVTRQV